MTFRNRQDAGRALAQQLGEYRNRDDVIVLALPRGGVPVAFEVAESLAAPLDIFLVRKLGLPGHKELAMGAVAGRGIRVLNQEVVDSLHIPAAVIDEVAEEELAELERREQAYRRGRPAADVADKIVILIDDGLATGSTMRAAVAALDELKPRKLIIAVPVSAESTCHELSKLVDQIVCLSTPEPFGAVGMWYDDFREVSDHDVVALLERAARQLDAQQSAIVADVRIPLDTDGLDGSLTIPKAARGLVLFAHGSGSSRHSPRNQFVARTLNHSRIATLLVDLLTPAEERIDTQTARLRFDIDLLANRLRHAIAWLARDERTRRLPLGLFGASTGAAAALIAAAQEPAVRAVVSRGGRPDLARHWLEHVMVPVLLIVGSRDVDVLALNREAHDRLVRSPTPTLSIVPGATHLFEESGALEEVAKLAATFFAHHLADATRTEE